tara:strand:+ start:1085 stop:1219 length:135 start_codon:yes stop_codon:yes gene_type:complete
MGDITSWYGFVRLPSATLSLPVASHEKDVIVQKGTVKGIIIFFY